MQYSRLSRRDIVAVDVLKVLLAANPGEDILVLTNRSVVITDALLERLSDPPSEVVGESVTITSEFDDLPAESLSRQDISDKVLGDMPIEINGID
jgi:hypothetical protein